MRGDMRRRSKKPENDQPAALGGAEDTAHYEPVAPLQWWLDTSRQDIPPDEATDPSWDPHDETETAAQEHETASWVDAGAEVEPTATAPASARPTPTNAERDARADVLEQREQRLVEAEADLAERTHTAAADQAEKQRRLAETEAALTDRGREVEHAAEKLSAQEQQLRAEREELARATTALKAGD